jgi:hypothetical protein
MTVIGNTADGAIVLDRHNSHLHGCAREFIVEAMKKVNTAGRQFIEAEIEMGYVIGECICVDTSPEDIIVFAQRANRKGLTRFVTGRAPEPTTKALIVLKKSDNPKEYILITAFAGKKAEVEPWDPRASRSSLEFWGKKALIWGSEEVVDGTVTTECPW